jgi:hypothetical protein
MAFQSAVPAIENLSRLKAVEYVRKEECCLL